MARRSEQFHLAPQFKLSQRTEWKWLDETNINIGKLWRRGVLSREKFPKCLTVLEKLETPFLKVAREIRSQRKRQERKFSAKNKALHLESAPERHWATSEKISRNWENSSRNGAVFKREQEKNSESIYLEFFGFFCNCSNGSLIQFCAPEPNTWQKKICNRKITQNERIYYCFGCNCIMHFESLRTGMSKVAIN